MRGLQDRVPPPKPSHHLQNPNPTQPTQPNPTQPKSQGQSQSPTQSQTETKAKAHQLHLVGKEHAYRPRSVLEPHQRLAQVVHGSVHLVLALTVPLGGREAEGGELDLVGVGVGVGLGVVGGQG